jgi:hypothetical protein
MFTTNKRLVVVAGTWLGRAGQQVLRPFQAKTHTLLGRSALFGALILLLPFFAVTDTVLRRPQAGTGNASLTVTTAGCVAAHAAAWRGTALVQVRANMLLQPTYIGLAVNVCFWPSTGALLMVPAGQPQNTAKWCYRCAKQYNMQ